MTPEEAAIRLREVLSTVAEMIGVGDDVRGPLELAIKEGKYPSFYKFAIPENNHRASYDVEFRIGRTACRFQVQLGNLDSLVQVEVNWSATGSLTPVEATVLAHKMQTIALLACQVDSYMRFQFRGINYDHFRSDYGEALAALGQHIRETRASMTVNQ